MKKVFLTTMAFYLAIAISSANNGQGMGKIELQILSNQFSNYGTLLFFAVALISGFFVMKTIRKMREDERNKHNVIGMSIMGLVFAGMSACTLLCANEEMGIFMGVATILIPASMALYTLTFGGIAASLGWFIGVGISTGQWGNLIIAIIFIAIMFYMGYSHEKKTEQLLIV